MAALPITQRGLDADLPPAAQQPGETPPPDQILLHYTADRQVTVNQQPVGLDVLEPRVMARSWRSSTPRKAPESRAWAS